MLTMPQTNTKPVLKMPLKPKLFPFVVVALAMTLLCACSNTAIWKEEVSINTGKVAEPRRQSCSQQCDPRRELTGVEINPEIAPRPFGWLLRSGSEERRTPRTGHSRVSE